MATLLAAACASGAAADRGAAPAGPGPRTYQVREATEAADTDGLDVKLEHGFINQESAQEAVMARWKDLTRCYGEAGEAMGFAGGMVRLQFMIDPGGATTEVRVVETQLGNYEVERCLISVGRSIRFPKPQGGAAHVDYSLEFRSSGERSVVDLPAGELDPALPALFARLDSECERLGADEVVATLYLEARGTVRSLGLAAAATLDEPAAACVSRTIRGWSAPVAALRAPNLGRITISLRSSDLLAHREAARYPRSVPRARGRRVRR